MLMVFVYTGGLDLNQRLNDRLVIITGASSGIGEKMAYKVAESGGNLILLARRKDRLSAISERIEQKYHVFCQFYELDVRDFQMIEKTFSKILKDHERIDVLVNNAGMGIFRSVLESSLDEMEAMFEINVYGMIACTKMVLEKMIEQKEGHIINIASQAGKISTPKSSLYAATKHAVLGFTNSLRMEASTHSIFVTAVNPGPIKTDFFELADPSGKYVQNVSRYMLSSDDVAEKIVRIMMTNKRELNLPWWMEFGSVIYRIMPSLFERLAESAFHKK